VSLLARVSEVLKARGIPHVLVGASALTIHGINRSTLDVDLFTLDRACLDPLMWEALAAEGVSVDVRKGDPDDPLAGVVRLEVPPELPLDVVVGKHRWQQRAIERAEPATFLGVRIPVLRGVDLILLKLFAGGPQDAWDIQQLLTGPERASLIEGVERELQDLPKECSRLWGRILEDLGS
jgi:predicted nucleotidyltransferase